MKLQKILMIGVVMAALVFGCVKKSDEIQSNADKKDSTEAAGIIHMNAERRSAAGLKIEQARIRPLQQTITVSGKVDFDQRRLAHLTSRVTGRVEQIFAFLGDRVAPDQLLATIYSQEYLTAQAEFVQAEERFRRAQQQGDSLELLTERAIYESGRKKLLIIGATEQDVKDLIDTRIPRTFLDVHTPLGGTVTEAGEILGHTVEVGTTLFHIADLTSVWVIVDVYEKDIHLLTAGLEAKMEVTAYPGEFFKGRLTHIFDVVDEKTRTIRARIEVENRNQKLKPGMFTSATLMIKSQNDVLVLPAGAIQRDGEKRYVFIAQNDSTFVQRFVEVGKEAQGWTEILNGVNAGESVVTAGAFTLRSELLKETFGEGD